MHPGADEPAEFQGTQRFRVDRKLGAGGMGIVYLAHDRDRDTQVALKTLKYMDGPSVYRFKQEFRALADLEHDNLIRLGELFCEGNQWFFTMELIAGTNFLSYVRGSEAEPTCASPVADTLEFPASISQAETVLPPGDGPLFDERRLRTALAQLAQGLTVLHGAHKVHRDIKPSNVLVTSDGRVVLLDFGLVAEMAGVDDAELPLVGTARYMAPEQASSHRVGPEADWYSVGVVVYEALTGRAPFVGRTLEVLAQKQREEPPPPRMLVPHIPGDLDALCSDLLRLDPRARPTGAQILARLGLERPTDHASRTSLTNVSLFVGRDEERRLLGEAFETSREARAVTVFVHGESGLGKSALVRKFTGELSGGMVLWGRCFERESVPYKALDGIVDALSGRLCKMPAAELDALLPPDVGALARLFPVLRRVPQVTALSAARLPDAQELRARAFLALRTLLARLAAKESLVLVIDDFQWTDADSMTLLAALFSPPEAPRLLLLCTVQTLADSRGEDPVGLVAGRLGDVRHLHLQSLLPADAHELCVRLVQIAEGDTRQVGIIAREAGGHPLYLQELVRHLMTPGVSDQSALRLEDVLWGRIQRLDEPARALLEVLAVAGVPLDQRTAGQASALDAASLARWASALRVAHLLRSAGTRTSDRLEPYHNRVREAVLTHLSDETRRSLHARLAEAFEATGAGLDHPQRLVSHWEAAGERQRAAVHAERAAQLASEALAFEQAAELYESALRLGSHDAAQARALKTRLGDALANAGRGARAAVAYGAAALGAEGPETLELHRRSVEQLLMSGHIDEGLEALGVVLAGTGMDIPTTSRRALVALVFLRLRVKLRGLGYQRRDESQISPEVLTRIDICWSTGSALAVFDLFRGAVFQVRYLLGALDAGEPFRMVLGLNMEAVILANAGQRNQTRSARLLAQAGGLARELGQAKGIAFSDTAAGIVALMQGRWRASAELCDRADAMYRERCTGVTFEMDTTHLIVVSALGYMGDLIELGRRLQRYLQSASERGDLYAMTYLTVGDSVLTWLARDEPGGARKEILEATERYSPRAVLVQHFLKLMALGRIDLYRGEGRMAWTRLQEGWPALQRSLLLHSQVQRVMMTYLRAQAALAAAVETKAAGECRALVAAAAKDASRIGKEGMPYSDALATLVAAGVAHARGQLEQAASLYARAAVKLDGAEMVLHAAAARWRQGQVIGGDAGQALIARARGACANQTIQAAPRFVALYAAGPDPGT
jgi:serine/threonine protein kinase